MAYSKKLAQTYAARRGRYRSSDDFLVPLLRKAKLKNKSVLDFGCGDGSETEMLLRMGAQRVVGIDPSEEMIRLAQQKKFPHAAFLKTDGHSLPFGDAEFDMVYSRFVLHYIKDLEPQFEEVSRVLKKSGHFLAIFQCLTNDQNLLNKKIPINLGRGKFVTKIHILSKSPDEVREAVRESNLRIIKFAEIKSTDAQIDPKYKNKHEFKSTTYILFAKRV